MACHSRRLLASVCISAMAVFSISAVARAQDAAEPVGSDADEANSDVIIVSGFRASLEQAAEIKRESIGVVDAITAEDIGKFPDANLAESLQRIPGVSIDRSNNEGNQVTVRGFGPSFNLVTLNGRQMPNSSSLQSEGVSRSFNFRELGSEGVAAVEVYKTGQADIYSGGLGAAVNVRTPRPFDQPGFRGAVTAKALWDTGAEVGSDVTPELSGLVSSTFADDRIGVLLLGSYSKRNSHTDRIGTSSGWRRNRTAGRDVDIDTSAIDTSKNPTESWWVPFTIDQDVWDTQRERINGQAVLQAEPIDGLVLTADYTMSRFKQTTQMNRMSFWFDAPDEGIADENGTLVDITTYNDQLNFWAWDFYHKGENDSFGLNAQWEITDGLTFEIDAHDSTSKSNPDGQTSESIVDLKNPGQFVTLFGTFSDKLPTAGFDDSALPPNGAYDVANIESDLYQKRGYSMDNNIRQIRGDLSWEANDAVTINVGGAYTDYAVDTALSTTFFLVNVPIDGLDLQFNEAKNPDVFPLIPDYSVEDFLAIVEDEGKFVVNAPVYNGITEETIAAYASLDLEGELFGMPARANVGLRYENTDVEGYSVREGILGFHYRNLQGMQVVYDGVVAPQTLSSSYSQFLPNFTLSFEPSSDVVLRAAYSKTIARSAVGAMFPGTNIAGRPGGPFTASQGNPGLLPYESQNLDFSAEYYYQPGSYVSVGVFKKWVSNFIGAVQTIGPIYNVNGDPVTDPSANPRPGCPDNVDPPTAACISQPGDPVVDFEISSTGNLRDANVQGLEAAVQHVFGDTGFGLMLNGTIVDGNIDYDVYDVSGDIFALTGLSNSANAVAFYEKNGIQGRVSYNWRDKFLLGFTAGEPIFTEAYGQIDVSASYDITDNLNVFVEGLNITDAATRRHGRFKEQLIDYETYGSRYSLGVRAKF